MTASASPRPPSQRKRRLTWIACDPARLPLSFSQRLRGGTRQGSAPNSTRADAAADESGHPTARRLCGLRVRVIGSRGEKYSSYRRRPVSIAEVDPGLRRDDEEERAS